MIKRLCLFILIVIFLNPAAVEAQWEPVSAADWETGNAAGIGAEYLFEKVYVDDRKLNDNKSVITIYNRIRIYNSNGRNKGDVTIPYYVRGKKIEEIKGHTILPDGQMITLDEKAIRKKEITRKNGVTYTEHSFSLPGVTDDCIIEYYIKYRLPSTPFYWLIQKRAPLRYGELRWRFSQTYFRYRLGSTSMVAYFPNHTWLNYPDSNKLSVDVFPSQDSPEEILFSIRDVPAFVEEPHTLPNITLITHLRFYYGDGKQPLPFWEWASQKMNVSLHTFYTKNEKVGKIVETFSNLATDQERINAAYFWCQMQLDRVNEAVAFARNHKESKNADEVIKRGYGTTEEINRVFYTMLRMMGIETALAYVVDRDNDLLIPQVKYARFAAPLVGVREEAGYRYYSPGHAFLPPGSAPPFHESITALLVGIKLPKRFAEVPASEAGRNLIRRTFNLQMAGSNYNYADGTFTVTRLGHSARDVRLSLAETDAVARLSLLKEEISESMADAIVSAVTPAGVDDPVAPLVLEGRISEVNIGQTTGSRIVVKPFGFVASEENPFPADTRRHAMMFDYAHEVDETVRLDIPDGWTLESMPSDTVFSNDIGHCEASMVIDGNMLTAHRRFVLNRPYWPAEQYTAVQKLFLMRQALNSLSVVFKKQ